MKGNIFKLCLGFTVDLTLIARAGLNIKQSLQSKRGIKDLKNVKNAIKMKKDGTNKGPKAYDDLNPTLMDDDNWLSLLATLF